MPQLYLNLPTIFIEIAASCTKLLVHTCFNKAGRLRYQVPSIKTNISSDFVIIIVSNLYSIGHAPVTFRKKIEKNEKVIKKIQKYRFFLHTL